MDLCSVQTCMCGGAAFQKSGQGEGVGLHSGSPHTSKCRKRLLFPAMAHQSSNEGSPGHHVGHVSRVESKQQVEGTCGGLAVQVEERIASRGVVLQTRLEEAAMELLSDVQRVVRGAGGDERCVGEGIGKHSRAFHVTERQQSTMELAATRVGGDNCRPEHDVGFGSGVEHGACGDHGAASGVHVDERGLEDQAEVGAPAAPAEELRVELAAVAVQAHGGAGREQLGEGVLGGCAKWEHARVERERPVAVPGAEEGGYHGGVGHGVWARHFAEHPGGAVPLLAVGIEDEEGASEDGVGGGQATTARLGMYLVREAAVAAPEQGGIGELVGGSDGGVGSENAAEDGKCGGVATAARVASDGGGPGGGEALLAEDGEERRWLPWHVAGRRRFFLPGTSLRCRCLLSFPV